MLKRISVFLLMCIVFLVTPLPSSAEIDLTADEATITVGSLTVSATEGDTVTYSLPIFISNIPACGLAGLLFSLRLPEGWSILSVELSAELSAELSGEPSTETGEPWQALTLTCRLCESGNSATVLLDGRENVTVSTPDPRPLLILTVQATVHATAPILEIAVPETGGLYYYNGRIPTKMPASIPTKTPLLGGLCAPDVPSLPEESTPPSTEASTGSVLDDPDPAALPRPIARYIGCQETATCDGTYAVRFLFLTPDPVAADTACVWLAEGTGQLPLSVRVTVTDAVTVSRAGTVQAYPAVLPDGRAGMWRLYTFEGLSPSARYTFVAVGSDGAVCIIYDMGKNIKNST